MTTTLSHRPAAVRRLFAPSLGAAAALAFALSGCGGGGGTTTTTAPIDSSGIPSTTQYLNPVLDADFPDPAVVRGGDGNYYAYATQTIGVKLQVARSANLVTWTNLGAAMPTAPNWAIAGANFWAPDVELREGRYVMYFAAQIQPGQKIHSDDDFCIGMATSTTAAGPFVDVGHPVVCGPGFTTIDPQGFDDPKTGKRYLYWGSSGAPLKVQELAADRASFVAGSTPTSLFGPRLSNDGGFDTGLIEGPWVTYAEPYYYLYFSGNDCCGPAAHYAVMVARATSPTGPFTVLTSASGAAQPILAPGTRWLGPGHNSTIKDGAGVEWMLYHAVDINHKLLPDGGIRRPLLIDRITYVNGWPTVGAGVPSSTPQTRPTP